GTFDLDLLLDRGDFDFVAVSFDLESPDGVDGDPAVGALDLEVMGFLGGQVGTVDVDDDVIAVPGHRHLGGGFHVDVPPTLTDDRGLGVVGHAVVVLTGDRHLPPLALLSVGRGGVRGFGAGTTRSRLHGVGSGRSLLPGSTAGDQERERTD